MEVNRLGSYRVVVERSGDWWAFSVPEIRGAFGQAKRLEQVRERAREVVALMLDSKDEGLIEVNLDVKIPANAKAAVDKALELRREVEVSEQAARQWMERAAKELHGQSLSIRDIGDILGVSHQRVHQIFMSMSSDRGRQRVS